MHAPSIRTRRIVSRSGGPVAVLLAGLLVWQGSNAAFTAETYNAGNNWETGSVGLTDDDAGSAMFSAADLTPDDIGSKCIVTTATSDVAGVVKMYIQMLTPAGLEDNIKVTIEQGTGGSFAGGCGAFVSADPVAVESSQSLAALYAAHGTYGNGILGWTKGAGTLAKTYKFSWVFDTTGLTEAEVNALQGTDVQANFEWELENT